MKKIDWAFASIIAILLIIIFGSGIVSSRNYQARQRRLHEEWSFVGRTPSGSEIYKKYFPEHGVWIFITDSQCESISAVPLEVKK